MALNDLTRQLSTATPFHGGRSKLALGDIVVSGMDVERYLETVRARLVNAGFALEEAIPGAALQARRRAIKLTRFGLVETIVAVSTPRGTATRDDVRSFSAAVFQAALEKKTRVPRGLGSSMVTYPVLVVHDASAEARRAVAEDAPKHWAALVFPVVVEPVSQTLLCLEKTPFWGAAYYRRTRAEARELLDPK